MACLHVYVYAFVIRMKNLKIMWVYFMKYCLTSKVQKKKFMDLNPELWCEISTRSGFFLQWPKDIFHWSELPKS
jgi:hypothetical protein